MNPVFSNTIETIGRVREIIEGASAIAALPAVSLAALGLASDPDASCGEVATVVEQDVSLTASLLSLANSAAFSTHTDAATVRGAVSRIGMSKCRHVLTCAAYSSMMQELPPEFAELREIEWKHSVETASLATTLNNYLGLGFEGEEYTAALMHDIGILLIGLVAPDAVAIEDRLQFDSSNVLLDMERAAIGTDHCEIGALYSIRHSVPLNIGDVSRHHHQPEAGPPESRLLTQLVGAADHIASHLLLPRPFDEYDSESNLALQAILQQAGRELDEVAMVSLLELASEATADCKL